MSPKAVPDVEALRALLEFRFVQVHELSGKLSGGASGGASGGLSGGGSGGRGNGFGPGGAAGAEPLTIEVSIEVTEDALSYRGRVETKAGDVQLVVDLAAIFALSEEIEKPSHELMNQFSRETGLPAVTPHLRSHVEQLAAQFGVAADLVQRSWPEQHRAAGTPEPGA